VLDNDEVVLEGVRFLGTTLWTDFMVFGDGEKRDAAIQEVLRLMYDFSKIHVGDAPKALFTPADSAALFKIQAEWLESKLAEPFSGSTVVITHHAPSRKEHAS
jgi:hypothetical protein